MSLSSSLMRSAEGSPSSWNVQVLLSALLYLSCREADRQGRQGRGGRAGGQHSHTQQLLAVHMVLDLRHISSTKKPFCQCFVLAAAGT